ncbi:hypothetical protein CPAV1605_462 [seawater metagenome]|uniref:Uncharacterized protein n=1 Tax=seawater metagenome TaxID=1561972 RepID=A0A5E8CI33_9ZZZZ
MPTYTFSSFSSTPEKISNTKQEIKSQSIGTAQHKHFFKGDSKINNSLGLIQFPSITSCHAIIITHTDYPFVHAYHAPPGSFPLENSSTARIKGDIELFINEIKYIKDFFKVNPNEIDIKIAGKKITKYRLNYLQDQMENIFQISKENINLFSLECQDKYTTNDYIQYEINICPHKKIKIQKPYILVLTISYCLNNNIFQITGPPKKSKEKCHILKDDNKWKALSFVFLPTIQSYIGTGI